jgi:hypothetical protein
MFRKVAGMQRVVKCRDVSRELYVAAVLHINSNIAVARCQAVDSTNEALTVVPSSNNIANASDILPTSPCPARSLAQPLGCTGL